MQKKKKKKSCVNSQRTFTPLQNNTRDRELSGNSSSGLSYLMWFFYKSETYTSYTYKYMCMNIFYVYRRQTNASPSSGPQGPSHSGPHTLD